MENFDQISDHNPKAKFLDHKSAKNFFQNCCQTLEPISTNLKIFLYWVYSASNPAKVIALTLLTLDLKPYKPLYERLKNACSL